ncbi:MAG: ectonucleotide pyrophosphatase/phosphodiesterase [Planctomycetota bacterium]|jgi:predicted AlkP superfamily pyrophosphatase or phosphodiesterase|nr:ectonucleotide pyrophosphatase/phosphodiesterase [Planctomycetota bacterium]
MHRISALSLLGLAVLCGCASNQRLSEHVILISVDGLRPEYYLPSTHDSYPTPNIQRLREDGVHARKAIGIFPATSYPNHASMVTGVRPDRHGIDSHTPPSARNESPHWKWEASRLQSRPLWYRARQEGLTVGISFWPSTVGAQRDAHWVVPERWSVPGEPSWIDLIESLSTPDALVTRPASLLPSLRHDPNLHAARDRLATVVTQRMLNRWEPDLMLVHLTELGVRQVQHGLQHEEVRSALARVDFQVGQIRESVARLGLSEKTTVIVVGTPGVIDIHTELAPNVLFAKQDWKAYAHAEGSQAAIYAPGEWVDKIRKLLEANRHDKGIERYDILDAFELKRLGAYPRASLAIVCRPGFSLVEREVGPFVSKTPNGAAWGGDPNEPGRASGFLAAGPGIAAGEGFESFRLLDISPTVATILGFQMGDDLDGKPCWKLFKTKP